MPPSRDAEDSVFRAAANGLKKWLNVAREKVMAPWRRFRAQPAPQEIQSTVPVWEEQVDDIVESLTPSIREGWGSIDLPPNLDLEDPFVQANLAMTRNLIVRVPDEVHMMIIQEILEGTSNQESLEEIAERVENVLNYTGSENWINRAKVIAQTESNRHYNSGALAHGLRLERDGRRDLRKVWNTRMDGRERPWHHDANGQEQPLVQPFLVGGEELLFPCDPRGAPFNVINCRCVLNVLWRF